MADRAHDAFVVFDHVQKSYDGETIVVADLNLAVQKGEFVTMLGPSGSGKTTCLMLLAGFEAATKGEIFLDGKAINNIPPHKRGIGMVFQNYALFPHMSVAENLSFPLEVRGIDKSEREEKVERALGMVRMKGFGGRRPSQLSGGQQQRIAVARSLVFDAELVLMDEPLGALDKNLREEMQYEIKHLHESLGMTVVYVTHDQGEALTMSDRIAVFDNGRIQQLDEPSKLYEEPATSFVAQFIGENNRLRGRILSRDGDRVVVDVAGHMVSAVAVNCGSEGEVCQLSVRPERIEIGEARENTVPAVVRELIYHGDHIRCRLEVLWSEEFIVKVPNNVGVVVPTVDQATQVSWDATDCRALDNETDASEAEPH